jgi:cytoskeletal protein RodZ
MSPFVAKPLATLTVGETLRASRQEQGWSAAELARETNIHQRFIAALEEDRHAAIPGDVYLRQWLRTLASTLKLSSADLIAQWMAERTRGHSPARDEAAVGTKNFAFLRPTARHLRWLGAGIAAAAAVGFLGVRLYAVVAPPLLVLDEPSSQTTTLADTFSVEVKGHTAPEATVTINKQVVTAALRGEFSQTVPLHRGVNAITVSSRTKHSFSSTVQRVVIVEASEAAVP